MRLGWKIKGSYDDLMCTIDDFLPQDPRTVAQMEEVCGPRGWGYIEK